MTLALLWAGGIILFLIGWSRLFRYERLMRDVNEQLEGIVMESNNIKYWVVTWPGGRHEMQSFANAMRTAERLGKDHLWVSVTYGDVPKNVN